MKITAYKVDCCHKILNEDHANGVIAVPKLDGKYEYKLINSRQSVKHFCLDCWAKFVTTPAGIFHNKNKKPDEYHEKVNELREIFFNGIFKKEK